MGIEDFFNWINEIFEPILEPAFSPLLSMDPLVAILIISFVITLLITVVYKYTTDQERLKKLRKELKVLQEKMKRYSKEKPEKVAPLNAELMSKNMEMMKQSMKSTLYTFLPIIIIFGWLNANMAFYPLMPNEPFDVTVEFDKNVDGIAELSSIPELNIDETAKTITDRQAVWTLSGEAGTYQLFVKRGEDEVEKKILITEDRRYEQPESIFSGKIKKIEVGNERVHPFRNLSLFGWHPGWFGTYFIFTILLSMILRKALNVA